MHLLWIAGFGLIGIFARYGLGLWVGRFWESPFPISTFAINILGSFLIGVVSMLAARAVVSEELRLGMMVGLLGGFTTFSAFSLELMRLWQTGQYAWFTLYLGASPVLGFLAAIGGQWVVRGSAA